MNKTYLLAFALIATYTHGLPAPEDLVLETGLSQHEASAEAATVADSLIQTDSNKIAAVKEVFLGLAQFLEDTLETIKNDPSQTPEQDLLGNLNKLLGTLHDMQTHCDDNCCWKNMAKGIDIARKTYRNHQSGEAAVMTSAKMMLDSVGDMINENQQCGRNSVGQAAVEFFRSNCRDDCLTSIAKVLQKQPRAMSTGAHNTGAYNQFRSLVTMGVGTLERLKQFMYGDEHQVDRKFERAIWAMDGLQNWCRGKCYAEFSDAAICMEKQMQDMTAPPQLGTTNSSITAFTPPPPTMEEDATFDDLDTNGDGYLTPQEFIHRAHVLRHNQAPMPPCEQGSPHQALMDRIHDAMQSVKSAIDLLGHEDLSEKLQAVAELHESMKLAESLVCPQSPNNAFLRALFNLEHRVQKLVEVSEHRAGGITEHLQNFLSSTMNKLGTFPSCGVMSPEAQVPDKMKHAYQSVVHQLAAPGILSGTCAQAISHLEDLVLEKVVAVHGAPRECYKQAFVYTHELGNELNKTRGEIIKGANKQIEDVEVAYQQAQNELDRLAAN